MTDAELWQACVESGFVASEWWPLDNGIGLAFDGQWHWYPQILCTEADAEARILAALVEWATTEGRGIESLFRYSTPTEHMKCGAEVHPCNRGEGTCPVAALLECYRQSKETA